MSENVDPRGASPGRRHHDRSAPTKATEHDSSASKRHKMTERDRERERDDPKHIGPWRIGKTIGKGSSGRVKIARHTKTHQYAAVKIVPKPRTQANKSDAKQDKLLLGIEREIVIMKLVEHPNVLQLLDVWETGSELYLVMEYAEGGELFDYLVSKGKLHADEALHYFQQIIFGVDYCHRFNICHRDLKPENLLLDSEKNIKIADFGMAALERENKLLETSCGSPHYASPEIVAGLNYHGSSSDIWSCGIILFALLTGRLPFDDENIRNLLAKVKLGRYTMPPELPEDAKDLIKRMLEVDPSQRITMEEIQAHRWFTRLAPRPVRGAAPMSPPSIDQIDRPVASREDIDTDILVNLKTLWNGTDEEEVIRALLSPDKTWEKVFYCLLVKFRARHLENFNMDDEDEEEMQKPRRQERKKESVPSAAQVDDRRPPQLSEIGNTVPTTRTEASSPTKASRAASATPIAAQHTQNRRAPLSSPPRAPRALPSTPQALRSQTTQDSAAKKKSHVPAIQLQQATPDAIATAAPPSPARNLPGGWESTPTTPTPALPSAFDSSAPPVLPIQIPQTSDAVMNQFFHDLVNQLQAVSVRTSVPSSPVSTPASTHRSSYLQPTSPAPSPMLSSDMMQFEDAEDDISDAGTSYSRGSRMQSEYERSPRTAGYDQYGSVGSSHRTASSTYYDGGSPYLQEEPSYDPSRPRLAARGSSRKPVVPPRPGLKQANYTVAVHADERRHASQASSRRPPPLAPRPGAAGRAPLGLAISSADVPDFRGEPLGVWNDSQGSYQRRRNNHKSVAFSPASPVVATYSRDAASPKRSWFAGLFNWKSLTYTLMSTEDVNATRRSIKNLLDALGVSVMVENADRLAILKCRVNELRDFQSHTTTGPLKPVKFRVEFSSHTSLSVHSPVLGNSPPHFPTQISLIMEKGAHSTFKATYNRLRSMWDFDSPGRSSAHAGHAVRLIPSPAPSPVLGHRSPILG